MQFERNWSAATVHLLAEKQLSLTVLCNAAIAALMAQSWDIESLAVDISKGLQTSYVDFYC